MSEDTPNADGEQPRDTMRGRSTRNAVALWVLLDGNRWLVALGLLIAILGGLLVAGAVHPNAAAIVEAGDPVETLFQAFVTATITGVTLVLTLNQLVLSQELGAVGDQRERMTDAMEFRKDVEDVLNSPVSPADPSAFLRALVDVTSERARTLRDALEADDQEFADYVEALVDSIEGNARQVSTGLEGEKFGEYAVISAALNFNYSWKLYTARRIQNEYGDSLDENADEALSELIETLVLFGPAREHFKTLYFQSDLIDLSRTILTAAVPALFVSIAVLVYFDASGFIGSTLGLSDRVWFVAITSTIALMPFAILLAYVLRIATVTQRTLSIGPFILRETDRDEQLDWE